MELRRKLVFLALFLIGMFMFFVCSGCDSSSGNSDQESSYFNYRGYSKAEFNGYVKETFSVAMSDNVVLAVDVFIPSDGPNRTAFPVVFSYTPYNRATVDLTTGTINDFSGGSLGKLLLSHGYALVVADMRGTGASFGTQIPFSPQIGQDGKELIDWIASQAWCDGNVGMAGGSYVGWSQLVTAQNKPDALKCITPEVILFEGYTGGFRPGGIAAINWIYNYSALLNGINLNYNLPQSGFLPCAPVIDEDGDGELSDEIPIMTQGSPVTFLDDGYPPTYEDNANRLTHYYYLATAEHLNNPTFAYLGEQMPFIDSQYQTLNFLLASPGYMAKDIMDFEIPIYFMGGWFDGFCNGITKLYATMNSANPSKMVMGPRFHQARVTAAYAQYFGYTENLGDQLNIERLRFFDRYLKDIENGIDKEAPVYLYVMNEGWRKEAGWPLARQVVTNYYFNENNNLTTSDVADGSDAYNVDYTHNSLYGSNLSDRWYMMVPPDSLMDRTQKDAQCLIYETGDLAEDVEVTGYPIVEIWLTSNQVYGDVFVYLVDVDENGTALHVTDGRLRAGWNQLHNDDDQVGGVLDVQPDLPWHGYEQAQWVDSALDTTDPISMRFELFPTSWVFKKGHKIRVAIAGADFGNFEINPGLSCTGPTDCPGTTLTVYRSSVYPSRIELPIIP